MNGIFFKMVGSESHFCATAEVEGLIKMYIICMILNYCELPAKDT